MKKYDIFLSYRRKGGWETAKHLFDLMSRDGYSVSFDIDTLREGLFDEELLRRIDQCTDFIVILDEHVFDRTIDKSCVRENDWLRRELAYAIEHDKNIIPVMLGGFKAFPDNLPDDIRKIKRYNGPKYDSYYFDNFYDRLLQMFIHSVPVQTFDDNNGCLKVLTDTECRVSIDYEDKGIARPRQIMRIPLCPGSYCLLFESTADKNNFVEDLDFSISAHTEKLYNVKLRKDDVKTSTVAKPAEKPLEARPIEKPKVFLNVSSTRDKTAKEMFQEGLKYHEGKDVVQDYKQAVYWFHKAAEEGYEFAMNNLGFCYENGKGVAQDYKQAVYWYKKAALNRNGESMYNLGFCYENGKGVAQDYKQAVYWYQMAAEKGVDVAMYRLGLFYYKGRGVPLDYNKAIYWFQKAAEKGNADAMVYLGVCYENGYGVSRDSKKTVNWFQKAVEKGNACAMYYLGSCYNIGYGVSQDYKQTVYWYHKAAEKGNADAMYDLGYCYYRGEGVSRDFEQVVYWVQKAAEKGNANAMYDLSVWYRGGYGVSENEKFAKKLYKAYEVALAGDEARAIQMVKDALR